MAFAFDEIFAYGGQLIVAAKKIVPKALGVGKEKVDHTAYIQGNTQIGKVDAFSGASATLMVGREDTIGTDRSVHVNGNAQIIGDGGTQNALYVTGGSSVDSVYIKGDLYVSGSTDCGNKGRLASRFAAADASPKPFDIKHPSKDGWRLRYACIEGPEVGVYDRGRVRNEKIIKLPDYWKDLVDVESISVQLQPIGSHQDIIVKRWDDQFIYLQAQGGMPVNCFYHVYAARKDVNPLYVEYQGESWKDYPDPNFNPDTAPDTPNYNDPEYRTKRNTITI
tara:strand:- start:404 stop:1240 length:837 start_codon:yes stop_codon:yes gene_type:complete